MAFSLVVSHGEALGVNGGTTSAIDTTGVDLLIGVIGRYYGNKLNPDTDFNDSKGNTWTPLTVRNDGATVAQERMYYCAAPVVGTGHTFNTVDGLPDYASLGVLGFSGSAASPFDAESAGGAAGSGTSVQPGSITPSLSNSLLVTGLCVGGASGAIAIDSSFTKQIDVAYSAGNNMGLAIGYLIQVGASAVNPSWSWSSSVSNVAGMGSFKAAAAGSIVAKGYIVRQAVKQSAFY